MNETRVFADGYRGVFQKQEDFLDCLNPASLETVTGCKVEAGLAQAAVPASFQFMRVGYFCLDSKDSAPGHLVFNRSVGLKDGFKK